MYVTAYLQISAQSSTLSWSIVTVTGAATVTTFPSSINSSLALWQISRTCASGIGRQARSCAIALFGTSANSHLKDNHTYLSKSLILETLSPDPTDRETYLCFAFKVSSASSRGWRKQIVAISSIAVPVSGTGESLRTSLEPNKLV